MGKVQAYVSVSVADMSILVFNGFLLLGFVVATVPDVLVLGSPGPTQVVDRDTSMKKCRYNRAYSMLEASCSKLELHDIPTNLKNDIQVRLSINTVNQSVSTLLNIINIVTHFCTNQKLQYTSSIFSLLFVQ